MDPREDGFISRLVSSGLLLVDLIEGMVASLENNMAAALVYTRRELLSLNLWDNRVPARLCRAEWRSLRQLGLLTDRWRPTKRGCRAGAEKQTD